MKKLTYYYHDINEEPGSFRYGMAIRRKLDEANIPYEIKHNEDVWEETYIMVKECDYEAARQIIERTPTMTA